MSLGVCDTALATSWLLGALLAEMILTKNINACKHDKNADRTILCQEEEKHLQCNTKNIYACFSESASPYCNDTVRYRLLFPFQLQFIFLSVTQEWN